MLDTSYDNKLREIEIYQLHGVLIPFIGGNYKVNKILHVGESHYLSQTFDTEIFSAEYFYENWWSKPCEEVLEKSPGYVDTRHVVEDNYLNGISGAYGIFTNVIKSYSKIVLGNEIKHISKDSKQIYNDFAFMNFYQMPSIYYGLKYWNSIYKSAKRLGNKELASDLWSKCVNSSGETLDKVISIIKPKLIIFTSLSAWDAYKGYEEKKGHNIDEDIRFVKTSHPASPISWNKPLPSLCGKTGQQVLEEKLQQIYEKGIL